MDDTGLMVKEMTLLQKSVDESGCMCEWSNLEVYLGKNKVPERGVQILPRHTELAMLEG